MLSLRDRIRVKSTAKRLAGWEGKIKYVNAAQYFIQFDNTPSITVTVKHEDVEKIEQ